MIYEMSRELGTRLAARKFPVRVVYGPERTQREVYDPIVVVERDRKGGDRVTAPTGNQRNPRKLMNRWLSVSVSVYAKSSLVGAMVHDHERECERLIDALLVALYQWQAAARAGSISIIEARYLSAADRNDVETWPGVVYVLRFQVPRAVYDLTYDGEAKPEAAVNGFANRTQVSFGGLDPETGCGAEP